VSLKFTLQEAGGMTKIIAISLVFLLAACGDTSEPEVIRDPLLHKGTDFGIQECTREGIPGVERRQTCIKENEKPLSVSIGGKGSYQIINGSVSFTGYLENQSTQQIITSFEVKLHHNDMPDGQFDTKLLDNLWVMPGETIDFMLGSEELTHLPSADQIEQADTMLYSWDMTNIKGVDQLNSK
jgi:hypothetical protein